MDLSIIVLNYKTKEVTADCLKSIQNSKDDYSKEVIIVDNQSEDGSLEFLKKNFPEYIVLSSGKNGGFAYGNNFGVKKAKGNYVWLLNSDTILEPDTIQLLMDEAVRADSDIASCQLLNPDGTIQPQGGFLPTLCNLTAWMLFIDDIPIIKNLMRPYQQQAKSFYKKNRKQGWLGGTALLVKRDVYQKLNGLDEKIFMYGEDVDFFIKANKLGFKPHYFSTPKLTHLGQGSGSSKSAILGEISGLKYIYEKHKPAWQSPILRLILKIGSALRVLLFGIILRDETRKKIYKEAISLA